MVKFALVLALLWSSISFADFKNDQALDLSPEVTQEISDNISRLESKYGLRLKVWVIPSFEGADPEFVAKGAFRQIGYGANDIVYVMGVKEKRSRFWLGDNVQRIISNSDAKEIHGVMKSYYSKRDYLGAFNTLVSEIDEHYQNPASYKKSKGAISISALLMIFAAFGIIGGFIVISSSLSQTRKQNELLKKYPGATYKRALELEKFAKTKGHLKALLKDQYPNESLYKSYRRLTKEYQLNKINNKIVNENGRKDYDYSYTTDTGMWVPMYFLMFNSVHTPLDFKHHSISSSSSGCGPAMVSSCGSGDSGGSSCGGGGCGGGGCGGCGS